MDLSYFTVAFSCMCIFANAGEKIYQTAKRDFPLRRDVNLLLENFQINANTIIRTQDSRLLGANYLNESDRPSNEECLRWCFEMNKCNVAVYEEKNRGSCYLFDCGLSDDFRCKFTTHSFYTSSVLKVDRDSYDFSQWQSQVKHESELASLRHTTAHPPETTTLASAKTDAPTPTQPPPIPPRVADSSTEPMCHHYQFACRNSSECIAIYNVCDGIPQCPDGSDEGKDLHCPGTDHRSSTTVPLTSSSRPSPVPPGVLPTKIAARPPPYEYMQQPAIVDDQILQEIPPAQQTWDIPHSNTAKQQPQPDEYRPKQSDSYVPSGFAPQHIFSNKHSNFVAANSAYRTGNAYGSGQWMGSDYYNEPYDARDAEYGHYHNYGYRRPDAKSPNTFDHYKHPVHYWQQADSSKYAPKIEEPINNKGQWQHDVPETYPIRYAEAAPSDAAFHERPQPKPSPRKSASAVTANGVHDVNAYQNQEVQQLKNTNAPSTTETATKLQATTDEETTKNPHQVVHPAHGPSFAHLISAEDSGPSVSELQQAGRTHAHESNSAVLALTLGLCVTALLLVLVGCRMKSIRRRLARRGRSSLAHDADYLVNGMYL